MFYLTIVNKFDITVTLGWHDSNIVIIKDMEEDFPVLFSVQG